MVKVKVSEHFSLYDIRHSGQCFRMNMLEVSEEKCEAFLVAYDRVLFATQVRDILYLDCSDEDYENIWKDYFDIDTDYSEFASQIEDSDTILKESYEYGKGIRILRQDLWETLISFIISQQNNIPRITRIIGDISKRYGHSIKLENKKGFRWFSFPTPESLANLTLDDISWVGLGYRDKYVLQAAKDVVSGKIDLKLIQTLPYEEAKKELLKIYGVGDKIADCVCLFALHHLEAFPKDVHINKILAKYYPKGFPERYKKSAGLFQQYLFYKDVHKKKN